MTRKNNHVDDVAVVCMTDELDKLYVELHTTASLKRMNEIYLRFLEEYQLGKIQQKLKERVDTAVCDKIFATVCKNELTVAQLVKLYDTVPTTGGVVMEEILRKIEKKAKEEHPQMIQQIAEKASYKCKKALLSIQGEING